MNVTYSEFKHLNPYKLSLIKKGYEMKRQIRDQEMWLWFGTYGRDAITLGVKNGVFGKEKPKYPKNPILSEEHKEIDIQKQREKFVAGLLAMQTNFELNNPKNKKE